MTLHFKEHLFDIVLGCQYDHYTYVILPAIVASSLRFLQEYPALPQILVSVRAGSQIWLPFVTINVELCLGPGFDVIGLALSIYLELHVSRSPDTAPPTHLNCSITYEGNNASDVPLDADQNLITQAALYVLRSHGHSAFPTRTAVHIINPIPLGRGLGSSGAAVVAGVILGNVLGGFDLPKARILDYCLMIGKTDF